MDGNNLRTCNPSCCIWPGMFSAMVNKWILVVVAVLLVLHAFGCKSCRIGGHEEGSKKKRR